MSNLVRTNGKQVRTAPFPQRPFFEEDEIIEVDVVLQSVIVNYWMGEECRFFEKGFVSIIGVNYAIAMMNSSMALKTTLMTVNIGDKGSAEQI